MELHPYLFCLFFCPLYFFLPPFEDNGLLFWVPDSSAGIQKLFCGIYSVFKCSFDEFVGEKVVSPSYSSAILGPPLSTAFFYKLITKRMLPITKVYVMIHHQEPCLPCLNVKLEYLCLSWQETSWPSPPVNGHRKEEINTSPMEFGWNQEIFVVTYQLFNFTSPFFAL